MAHLYQNKNIKILIVSIFKESAGPDGVWNFINITYGILDYIFQILDTEDVPVNQVMPCLAILSQKSENYIANIIKKPHNFVRKTKNYLKKSGITLRN